MTNVDYKLVADRGYVYKWSGSNKNPKATFTHCLVVSGESRERDPIVSVLFLYDGFGKGLDAVEFEMEGRTYHVHAEMVTYTGRNLLQEKIMKVDDSTMQKINVIMSKGLGIEYEDNLYKDLYDDLVSRIVKGA